MAPFSCENVIVDKCLQCGGIWFDAREIGVFTNSLRKFDLSQIEIAFRPPEREGYHVSLCPRDEETLVEGKHGYNSKVTVHRCNRCKGVWVTAFDTISLIEMVKISQAIEPATRELAKSLLEHDKDIQYWRSLKEAGEQMSRRVPYWRVYMMRYFAVVLPLYDVNPRREVPLMTALLIVLNVMVFLTTSFHVRNFEAMYAVWAMKPAVILEGRQLWTLFSSLFLHAGVLHLLGNMYFLWMFGDNVEDRLGWKRYLLFYLAVGVAADLAYILTKPGSDLPSLGASGAISGLMGAYLVFFPRANVKTLFFTYLVDVPAWVYMLLWFVLQIYWATVYTFIGSGGVAWGAHIGGFIAGALLASAFQNREQAAT